MTLNNLISKSIYYGEGNTSYGRITAQQEHEQILLSPKNRDMDAYKKTIHLHLKSPPPLKGVARDRWLKALGTRQRLKAL